MDKIRNETGKKQRCENREFLGSQAPQREEDFSQYLEADN